MRIAIEARALKAAGSGVHTYVRNLVAALPQAAPAHSFTAVSEAPRQAVVLPWWLNVTLPRRLRELRPDIVHYTKAAVPRTGYPSVVTVYDAIPLVFPDSQHLLQRWLWPATLRTAVRRSRHVLTISEASRRDIVRLLGADPARVTVTPLAPDAARWQPAPAEARERVRGHYHLPRPYILYVGRIEPRKNVPLLVRAFGRVAHDVPHDLVIVGRAYRRAQDVAAAVREAGVAPERVRMLGFVPDADLPAVVSGADVFVWPSIYEGWAFPVQEAQAAGVPVVVSDGGALPEVVGEAGVIVPFTTDDIAQRVRDEPFEMRLAQALREVLTGAERRKALREQGLARAAEFSWERVARATVAVYEQVYEEAA